MKKATKLALIATALLSCASVASADFVSPFYPGRYSVLERDAQNLASSAGNLATVTQYRDRVVSDRAGQLSNEALRFASAVRYGRTDPRYAFQQVQSAFMMLSNSCGGGTAYHEFRYVADDFERLSRDMDYGRYPRPYPSPVPVPPPYFPPYPGPVYPPRSPYPPPRVPGYERPTYPPPSSPDRGGGRRPGGPGRPGPRDGI